MNNIIFIQFYSKIENINPNYKNMSMFELCNGFSDSHDLCKNHGDFYWVNHSKQLQSYGVNKQNDFFVELPFKKGIVYVSAYYLSQLYQVYNWALEYPNIKFIVGGPSTNPKTCIINHKIPSNMFIKYMTVEQYFNVPDFSCPWNLTIPDESNDMLLTYSYTLRSSCYWGKCIFCNQSQGNRQRTNIKFEFLDINYSGKQRVNLYTPAMTSSQLKDILYNLTYDKNIRYDIYLRGNKSERETLKEIFQNKKDKFPQCKFTLGVEYPSDRMLKYINKNVTVEGILKTIKIISDYNNNENIQIQLPFILGWDNLESSDIKELEYFLNQLPYDKIKLSFSVNLLTAKPNTYVFDNYKKKKDLHIGPFYYGYIPYISSDQINKTKQSFNLLNSKKVTVFDYNKIKDM